MPPKTRSLIAAFGALVYALFGLRILLSSIVSLAVSLRDTLSQPGGGMFAFGIDLLVAPYFLLALASIVANVMLRDWARKSDARAKTLHRAQRWSIMLALAMALATVVGFNVSGNPSPLVLVPMMAIVWGAQFLVTAALLGMYAMRTSRS